MHFAINVLSLAPVRKLNWLQTREPVCSHRELQMVENQYSFLAEIHKRNASHVFLNSESSILTRHY
jgi:hypothetical protein